MRPRFWDYLREAFNARPIGMFVPPNWAGLTVFGLLALAQQEPGWLVIGAGAELGYLALLSTNRRFQRFVAGKHSASGSRDSQRMLAALLQRLPEADRRRYTLLAQRCQSVLDLQFHGDDSAPGYDTQSDSLGRLTWMYLRLLVTRQAILHVLKEPAATGGGQALPPPIPGAPAHQRLEARLADLRARLADPSLSDELRHSLSGQVELLEQRLARRREANEKLAFLDAELTRIEEQVELIREQAAISADPQSLSQRIDEIGATLGGTARWIADQQQALGAMDDLLMEPPPLTTQTREREVQ
jgi:hypothetical protein